MNLYLHSEVIFLAEEYLKSGEAAELLHITVMTLARWEKNGKLVPHHIDAKNGYKYYTRKQIHDFNKMRYQEKNVEEQITSTFVETTVTISMEEKKSIENAESVNVPNVVNASEISALESKAPQMTAEEVESQAVVAQYHYFSTAKPIRKLTKMFFDEMTHVPLGKTGYVEVTLISGDVEKPTMERPTLLDLSLIEGVVSLKKAGNKAFSVSQLLRHINGNSRNGCTDEKIAEATRRLRKMMEWRIRIDARPEFEHYKKLPSEIVEKAVFEGHLLNILYLETTNKRGEKNVMFGFPINECFEIPKDKSVAITHEVYSETIGKLTCFPTEMLNIAGVKKTDQNKIIANYLLQKIQGIKNNKRDINSIKFETLQKDCEFQDFSKQRMYKIRETIVKMLEYWKAQGHIKDYKMIKEKSGAYHGIEIEVAEAKKKDVRNGTGRGNKVHTRKSANVSDTNW